MTCGPGIFGLPHFLAVVDLVCVVVGLAVAVLVMYVVVVLQQRQCES